MVLLMNRTMPAFVAALAALLTASTVGAADRRYTVTDFDRVQVDGPFEVTLSTGKANSALARGRSQALERVSIDVQGRVLRVRPSRSAWGGYPGESGGPVRVELTTHDLRGASLSGSGSISIDKAKAMRFDAAVSGSGRLGIGSLEADSLNLGLVGSGRILIGGKSKELRATVQGNGDLDAEKLAVEDARINADTSGNIVVSVRRSASVTSTGSGDTRILGKPACTGQTLGSGRVLCGSK